MTLPFAPWADPGTEPLIDLRNVTKRFGAFEAVKDLSLTIYEREFFAILGPSGCGKTTLMRMLAGFETPNEGQILLDGQDLTPIPPARRPVNMMFQSYALFPHLTVEKNIAFGLKREGIAKGEIADRVTDIMRLVQLTDFARRKPDQLSGGQRQRVALARALVKRPRLLLLDEPLGALDKKLRQETQFELMNIQETLGTTFVIVTHDQEEAMTVSSRIAVMRDGELAQVATPTDLYERPDSRFVADFIGEVTVLAGRVTTASRGGVGLAVMEDAADLRVMADNTPPAGTGAWLAIRPEKVSIARARPEGADNALPGKVLDIAYLGNISTYHVELADGSIVKAQESNRQRADRRGITWEDKVWVSWEEDAGVLLLA